MVATPRPRIIDTRWVLGWRGDRIKARLVVIGCQESQLAMRTDAPTASHHCFMIVVCFASQPGWTIESYDATTAYLQSEGIARLLLLRLPRQNSPPGTQPCQVVRANGSIYGTRDAGRAFYHHLKKVFKFDQPFQAMGLGLCRSYLFTFYVKNKIKVLNA